MSAYSFDEQLAKGEKAETYLDTFFSHWYRISKVNMKQQRRGIDRRFINRRHGRILLVEYKTDFQTAQTGNVFLETVSVDTTQKPGWLYSSEADRLVYFIPQTGMCYCTEPVILMQHYGPLEEIYKKRSAENGTYKTWGILVPVDDFAQQCREVGYIGTYENGGK